MSHETPFSSSGDHSASSSEDDWEEAEIVVNREISENGQNPPECQDDGVDDSIIVATNAIDDMKRKKEERARAKAGRTETERGRYVQWGGGGSMGI